MVEMVVCTILLSVVGVILAPAIQSVNRQRKRLRYETMTAIQLNNLVEQVRLTDAVSDEADEPILVLEDWYRKRYPQAELKVEASTADAESGLVPVVIQIHRPEFGGHVTQRHSLVCWIASKTEELQSDKESDL